MNLVEFDDKTNPYTATPTPAGVVLDFEEVWRIIEHF